jgi:hypothetical protein
MRSNTAAKWQSYNPVLKTEELGYDTTNKKLKIGDGITPWNGLLFLVIDNGFNDSHLATKLALESVRVSGQANADDILALQADGVYFNNEIIEIKQAIENLPTDGGGGEGGTGENPPAIAGLVMGNVNEVLVRSAEDRYTHQVPHGLSTVLFMVLENEYVVRTNTGYKQSAPLDYYEVGQKVSTSTAGHSFDEMYTYLRVHYAMSLDLPYIWRLKPFGLA